MLHFKYLLLLLPILLFVQANTSSVCKSSVLICYGKLNPYDICDYDYVILEADLYSAEDIEIIKDKNKKVLCYISLGEVNRNASYFKELKGVVNSKNDIWNSYQINLNYRKTKDVLNKVIKNRLAKGFDGLFLDNIDNYTIHGNQYKQASHLLLYLKQLRKKYPEAYLMQNSGFSLLESTNPLVNALAVESVATNYNFSKKEYQLRESIDFQRQKSELLRISENYKKNIIVIEYANSNKLHNQIKTRLKDTNWNCFIGKIELQEQFVLSNK